MGGTGISVDVNNYNPNTANLEVNNNDIYLIDSDTSIGVWIGVLSYNNNGYLYLGSDWDGVPPSGLDSWSLGEVLTRVGRLNNSSTVKLFEIAPSYAGGYEVLSVTDSGSNKILTLSSNYNMFETGDMVYELDNELYIQVLSSAKLTYDNNVSKYYIQFNSFINVNDFESGVNDALYFYDTSYLKAFDIYEFDTFTYEGNTYIMGMWVINKHSSLTENNYYNFYRLKDPNEQS